MRGEVGKVAVEVVRVRIVMLNEVCWRRAWRIGAPRVPEAWGRGSVGEHASW